MSQLSQSQKQTAYGADNQYTLVQTLLKQQTLWYLHEAALSCDGPAASLTIITPLITLQKYQFKKPFCKGRTRDQGQGVQRITGSGEGGQRNRKSEGEQGVVASAQWSSSPPHHHTSPFCCGPLTVATTLHSHNTPHSP